MEVASRISPICRNLECSASNACDDALSGSDHRAGVNISCPAPVNSVNNFWPAIRGDLQTFANINTDILQSPMTAIDCSSTILHGTNILTTRVTSSKRFCSNIFHLLNWYSWLHSGPKLRNTVHRAFTTNKR